MMMSAVVVGVMTTMVLVNLASQGRNLRDNAQEASQRLADATLAGLAKPMAVGDNASVEAQLIAAAAASPAVTVHIFDPSLRVVFSSHLEDRQKPLSEALSSTALTQAVAASIRGGTLTNQSFAEVRGGFHNVATFRAIGNAPECGHCHGSKRAVLGGIIVQQETEQLLVQSKSLRRINIGAGILGTIIIVGLLYLLLARMVLNPVRELSRSANALARGDLGHQVRLARPGKLPSRVHAWFWRPPASSDPNQAGALDELDQLAFDFSHMRDHQRTVLRDVMRLVGNLTTVIDQVTHTTQVVGAGAQIVNTRVEQMLRAAQANDVALQTVSRDVDVLRQVTAQSTASVNCVVEGCNSVAQNVQGMVESVVETAAAIDQVSASVQQTTASVATLHQFVANTSAAMTEMDGSFDVVHGHANEAASMSHEVADNATQHAAAVRAMIDRIAAIRRSSDANAEMTTALGTTVSEITKMVGVIAQVTDKTTLLSLNAAIVAAHAGTEGRSFAVVADQIKELANRTRGSTQEIEGLVERIHRLSADVDTTITESRQHIDAGVSSSRATEIGLQSILASVQGATARVETIAATADEQSRLSHQVTKAVQQIAATVEELAIATRDQATSAARITTSTDRIRELSTHVKAAVQEQLDGAQKIHDSTTRLNGTHGYSKGCPSCPTRQRGAGF